MRLGADPAAKAMSEGGGAMDDQSALIELNTRFIDAFREGSWELLEPILSPSFIYLDGATGEVWPHDRYVENLRGNPAPALALDQVVVHVDGNTAVVLARTSRRPREIQPVRGHVRAKRSRLGLHPRLRLAVVHERLSRAADPEGARHRTSDGGGCSRPARPRRGSPALATPGPRRASRTSGWFETIVGSLSLPT
jgi:hypothetical protein